MGGLNPYLGQQAIAVAKQAFTLRIANSGQSIAVDPAQLPHGRDGRPGSLLDILLHHGVRVDHACGGVCSCSTCHVVVKKGLKSCNPADEGEEDMLDTAPGLTGQSRLACQCVPNGSEDVEVLIPAWNRNAIAEGE
jgi:2Fe-2S ferredoxin